MGASSPRKPSHNWQESEPGAGGGGESHSSAWLRLRCVYTGSDIGPQPLPTHVTDVTRSQVAWHVTSDTCTHHTCHVPHRAGEQVEAVAHNCEPLTRLLTHSTQCQGPRPPTRPRSPVPSSALTARLVSLSVIQYI